MPANSLDGGVLNLPYLAVDVFFLQKKVPFVCVCVYLASGASWVSACFKRGRGNTSAPSLPIKPGLCRGWRLGNGQHDPFFLQVPVPLHPCPHFSLGECQLCVQQIWCVSNPLAGSCYHPSFSDPVNMQCLPLPSSLPGAEVGVWKASLCPNRACRTWCR